MGITSSKTLNGTAGDYATVEGTITNVGDKLNPGQVLPVALGTPAILIVVMFLLAQRRRVGND